jgi:uncharacterized coiled-coil DUF342 family protein
MCTEEEVRDRDYHTGVVHRDYHIAVVEKLQADFNTLKSRYDAMRDALLSEIEKLKAERDELKIELKEAARDAAKAESER